MVDFFDRLLNEVAELATRLSKLRTFLNSKTYKELKVKDKNLLVEQSQHMNNYYNVLSQRINNLLIDNSYPSKANLPDSPYWDDTDWSTDWSLELKRAIKGNYTFIATPEGLYFKIISSDEVQNITIPKSDTPHNYIKEDQSPQPQSPQLNSEVNETKVLSVIPEHIENIIVNCEYKKISKRTTICLLTLVNGFEVVGESSCASEEKYNKKIGEDVSRKNAAQQIWAYEEYLLRQKLFEESKQ